MNKEKTAMQILIEEIESLSDRFQLNTDAKRIYLGLRDKIVNMNLLKKEQGQIENAFHFGYLDGIGEDVGLDKYKDALGKDYYQSKYGGE